MAELEGYFEIIKDGEVIAVGKGRIDEINWGELEDVKIVKKSNHGVDLPDRSTPFNFEVDSVELVKGEGYLLTRYFINGEN